MNSTDRVLRSGIYLTNDVVPPALKALRYSWYIMPEGGAYVYDAWQTPQLFNPNIVFLVQYQYRYGRSEGRSGRPTVLDHPLHVALFENNSQSDHPPHQRSRSVNNPLQPPLSCTPRYPHKLDAFLYPSYGDIERFNRQAYRGGIGYHMQRRKEPKSNPLSPPLDAYDVLYDEDDQRRSEAALNPLSPQMDSYGNIIGESTDPDSHGGYLDSFGNTVSYSEPERSYSANYPPIGENSVDSIVDSPRTATFIPMNSAEPETSSTVQEGHVGNIAVQCIGT
jgi:hypothetical protein